MSGIDELDDLLADLEHKKPASTSSHSEASGTIDLGELDDLVDTLDKNKKKSSSSSSSSDAAPSSGLKDLDDALDSLNIQDTRHEAVVVHQAPPPPAAPAPAPAPAKSQQSQSQQSQSQQSQSQQSQSQPSSNRCGSCNQVVDGEHLQALGKVWHTHCFKCHQCGGHLSGAFYEHNNRPTCENCMGNMHRCSKCGKGIMGQYFKLDDGGFLHTHCKAPCAKCGGVISSNEVQALGKSWHADCFSCAQCGKHLSSTFVRKNDQPHCESCGSGPSVACSKCRQNISGKYVSFEGKSLHNHCFRCNKCNIELSPSEFFVVRDNFQCKKCTNP